MSSMTRRTFIGKTAMTGAALSTASLVAGQAQSSGKVLHANEKVRVATIGVRYPGGRGNQHVTHLTGIKNVRMVALCDADADHLAGAVKHWEPQCGKLDAYIDVRELLDRKDIDAVTIASPNHWHSLMGIWACQAGKDVYVEKPVSHNVWEGRQLVRAARRYGRIVQVGTQARANPDLIAAVEWIRAGNLGKIRYIHGTCYNPRQPISPHEGLGDGPIPPGLNYDLWTGPASLEKPLRRQRLHYNWHWVFNTGNGDLGNQGIHEVDISRWFLGHQELAPRVLSIGGRLGYADGGETPNTQLVIYDYEPAPLIFEVRGLPSSKEFHDPQQWVKNMDHPFGDKSSGGIGVIVHCEGGRLLVVDGGQVLQAVDKDDKLVKDFCTPNMQESHAWEMATQILFENWVDAIRTRDQQTLRADIEQGHLSSALCHCGLVSHRLGRPVSDGTICKTLENHDLATKHYTSFRQHLARNGIDLAQAYATLGAELKVDPKVERFVGDEYANRFLTRDYRVPYIAPQDV